MCNATSIVVQGICEWCEMSIYQCSWSQCWLQWVHMRHMFWYSCLISTHKLIGICSLYLTFEWDFTFWQYMGITLFLSHKGDASINDTIAFGITWHLVPELAPVWTSVSSNANSTVDGTIVFQKSRLLRCVMWHLVPVLHNASISDTWCQQHLQWQHCIPEVETIL